MSDYQRSTRVCPFDQLRPEMQQAFRDYFNTHDLAGMDETSLVCCETVSHKKEVAGFFAWLATFEKADVSVTTAILLGAQALFWARAGEPYTPAARVICANLQEVRVKMKPSVLTQDSGLEISGLIEGSKGVMRGTIGLGPEPAAQKFCEDVAQAVEKVNPRPAGKFPSWMGGR